MRTMSVRLETVMQLASLPKQEGDGDAAACSTDTSRWSTPSRLDCGSSGPQSSGRKNVQEASKSTTNSHSMRLPQVKALQVLTPNVHNASTNCIKELRSQVWVLQQQLNEATTENKLLKKVQHRYMVALQHFQDSENNISEIVARHHNETRVLQGLLCETRISGNNAVRQLQATETKLQETKAAFQHLKFLSKDQSLLEREELSLKLAEATAKLEDKEKKIQEMEKNLALCQASFKRQIVTEQRKIKEAAKTFFYQQQHICQLTREIQDKEKELEQHNIYSHRYVKGSSKKVRKNKAVQTDGLVHTTAFGSDLLKTEPSVTEQQERSACCQLQEQGDVDIKALEKEPPANAALENDQKDTQMLAGQSQVFKEGSSENSCSEERPEDSPQQQTAKDKEVPENLQVCEEKQEGEDETGLSCILEMSQNANEPNREKYLLPTLNHNCSFKQTIDNLHNGQPDNSSGDRRADDNTNRTMSGTIPSNGIQDISLSGEKSSTGDGPLYE